MRKDIEKQICVDEIYGLLKAGKDRKEIMPLLTAKYKFGQKTFDLRLKAAREVIAAELRTKEGIRETTLPDEVRNEILEGIATESEIDLILSQIVKGNVQVQSWVKGEAVLRDIDPTEIINAADKLYKRKGSYAPVKNANTDKDGNDVAGEDLNTKFDTILNAIRTGQPAKSSKVRA